ncbi:Uncharacterised protein [Mycobacteroides abscessus]|nr:Uncharacterised protein [Mycobacteroides abscessus]
MTASRPWSSLPSVRTCCAFVARASCRHAYAIVRSIATIVMGVAMTTFFDTACSRSDGSCSTAAERNDSAGTNMTTNSGAGPNWSQ